MLEVRFPSVLISKFSGGAFPQIPRPSPFIILLYVFFWVNLLSLDLDKNENLNRAAGEFFQEKNKNKNKNKKITVELKDARLPLTNSTCTLQTLDMGTSTQ